MLRQPVLAQVDYFLALGVNDGHAHLGTQDGVILELHRLPKQGFLEHQGEFPGNLPVVGPAGLFVAVGSDSAGVEDVVFLGHTTPGQLLQDVVHQVGVLVFQPDDEWVGEVLHVRAADCAYGRTHLHRFSVHQNTDVLFQAEPAQGRDYRVLAHHFLPEDPVGVLHGDVHRVRQFAVRDGLNQAAHALAGQQATAGQGNAHVADRVFQEVGGRVACALRQDYRHVLQGFLGIGFRCRPPYRIEGDWVIGLVQAEGHGIEVVLGAVDAVGDGEAAALPVGNNGFPQGLQQHYIVVHGVDPFHGVGFQAHHTGQLAVSQLDHNGQGTLAVQGGAHGYQGGVGNGAVDSAYAGQAQGCLDGNAVVLLDLVHGDGQRAHLVLTDVVEPQVQGQTLGGGFEDQLVDSHFPQTGLQFLRKPQVLVPVGDGDFHDVRRFRPFGLGQVKGELAPHVR